MQKQKISDVVNSREMGTNNSQYICLSAMSIHCIYLVSKYSLISYLTNSFKLKLHEIDFKFKLKLELNIDDLLKWPNICICPIRIDICVFKLSEYLYLLLLRQAEYADELIRWQDLASGTESRGLKLVASEVHQIRSERLL